MASLGGGDALSGATGAGLNEAIQNELAKIHDVALHQWASAIVGAIAAKAVNGDAQTGSSTAASGTKNNFAFLAPLAVAGLEELGLSMVIAGEVTYLVNEYGAPVSTYVGDQVDDFILWASDGSPGNNQAQNRQTKAAARKSGLDKEQQRTLHDQVSDQGYGYKEIEEIAKRIADKELY